jgi:PAS domain S-box-containing protein
VAIVTPSDPRSTVDDRIDDVIDLVPVAVLHTDITGRCVFANRIWLELTGFTREEAVGFGWLDVLQPSERERALGYHRSSPPHPLVKDEFSVRTKTGGERVFAATIVPLHDAEGALAGHLCACIDISERQDTEEALRSLTYEYRERLKELDCLYEISHIVERAGGSLQRILRETVELLPRSWEYPDITYARLVIYEWDVRTLNYQITPWRQSAAISINGREAGHVEVGYLQARPNRDEGPFLHHERRLIDNIGERLGHIATRIMTAERLRDQEQELRERLTHLSRVSTMGEMASSLAHELNQPLTAVATYAQALRRFVEHGSVDTEELLSILDRIAGEALRAGNIVHRLKELVRRRETRREPCDLNARIRDVQQLANADARLHDAVLHMELDPHLPLTVADAIQIQQVLLNLIRNALDAMRDTDPTQREVVVQTSRQEGGQLQVSVSDRGCGTPAEHAEQIFQPFFTTKESGLGVGLSISKSIISSHGGHMWFSANEGGGTTFYFTLPPAEGRHGTE